MSSNKVNNNIRFYHFYKILSKYSSINPHYGISQISGASKTSVGGYYEPEPEDETSEQFDVSDNRTLDEVIKWLMEIGYLPIILIFKCVLVSSLVFCTAKVQIYYNNT